MSAHVVVEAGSSFAPDRSPARRRRIGGIVSAGRPLARESTAALREALGSDVAILDAREARTVVDADLCALGEVLLRDASQFRSVAGRTREISGSFSMAWLDDAGAVHITRDTIGHRTLYYAMVDGVFLFASTIRAILATQLVPKVLDVRAMLEFLTYAYVPGRRTLVRGVSEVLPGEVVTFESGVVRSVGPAIEPGVEAGSTATLSEQALIAELRGSLSSIVKGCSEGPRVCASLSGGIDSSLVVALAQRGRGERVRTFSITFGKEYRDELVWSSLVAEHCATEHTVVELTPRAIVSHLDDTMAWLDKPNGDPLTVPNALLFREMAQHGTIALNGEGGDPCFGGPKNLPMVLSSLYGESEEHDHPRALERSYLRAHLKCFDDLEGMIDGDVLASGMEPPLEEDLVPWFAGGADLLTKLMRINVRFKGGHHILPKVDALSSAFGVLPRSPLFSKEIVAVAERIPPQWKLNGAVEKYLLKEAALEVLPRSVVERPKSGMMVPVEGWFQGPLQGVAKERLLGGLRPRNLFRGDFLERLLSGQRLGLRPRRGVKIWLLITLESHLRSLGL